MCSSDLFQDQLVGNALPEGAEAGTILQQYDENTDITLTVVDAGKPVKPAKEYYANLDKKDLGDESPDVRERKEKLAAALKYLQGEISAAMESGYLSDEERESLKAQFSKAAGRRVEITPELYLLTVLNRKVRNADECGVTAAHHNHFAVVRESRRPGGVLV